MAERKGTALLMVYVDIDPEHDADFNAWYNEEHLQDLLNLPGFLNAARYEALKGGPRYLACYELASVEAVQSEAYQKLRRESSAWSQRISLSTRGRNFSRIVGTQIYPEANDPHVLGRGMAPALQVGRMIVPESLESKYNTYYDTVRTPANLEVPGCIAVRRYHAVEGEPRYMTVYEFEHEMVPESQPWHERRGQDRMHEYIGGTYGHAPGSPGVYRRIFPARPF